MATANFNLKFVATDPNKKSGFIDAALAAFHCFAFLRRSTSRRYADEPDSLQEPLPLSQIGGSNLAG